MAGVIGEGGIITVSGSVTSPTPLTLADFTPTVATNGPDGRPCNIYTVYNGDTSNTFVLAVCVKGLHTSNGSSSTYASVYPGLSVPFQVNEHANEITSITAWPLTLAGVATTGGTFTVAAWITSRRS